MFFVYPKIHYSFQFMKKISFYYYKQIPVLSISGTKKFIKSTEVESRTQGSRPRTQKKSETKAKDSPSENRLSRGQGQERSKPRTKDTGASVLGRKFCFSRSPKKRSSKKILLVLELRK